MKKILLGIGEELLSAVDEYCKSYKFERAEFLRSLIRERIYFDKVQDRKTPAIITKAIQAERKVEEVQKKASRILKSPLDVKSSSLYSFCPNHGVFYASCGCPPK